MRKIILAALLALLSICLGETSGHAQGANPLVLPGGCGTASFLNSIGYLTVDATGKACVNATVSASVSGFTPNGNFATLTASNSSGSVALPTGTTVVFQNVGAAAVSCTLGIGSATATASQNVIQPGLSIGLTVESNTFGACIDQTGSTSNLVVLSGGSGLFTNVGGGASGGGGGGGAVTVADGADVAQGATTDAACAGDNTSGCTIEQRLQRIAQRITSAISGTTVSGTVTANAGTNLNTSALALDATLGTTNTDIGPPGATACATDTGSCSLNALVQRLAQRITTAIAGTTVSGTVTANAGTNLNTSALALDATLGTTNTDIGPPGATACATDTGSCSLNALMQRLAQRVTTAIGGTTISGTVTANAGTNLNTSALALDASVGTTNTDLGPPGATVCATDTGSCSINALAQRLAQRLTTINTTLGSPIQATGGTVGIVAGTALIGKAGIDQTTPGTTNGVALVGVNGATALAGNGVTGTGSARVTISSDNSNSAGIGGSATGSAVPSSARYVGGNGSGNLTGVTVCDNWTAISQTTGTQIITGTSAKKTYICSINIVSATAQNIALVGGTGSVCATSTHAIAGGTTAATGWNFAANGGLTQGSGIGVIMQAGTAADNLCLLMSSTGQLSGTISWTQY
jgi:hypothetical protein